MRPSQTLAALLAATRLSPVAALTLDVTDPASIKSAAKTIAAKMLTFYPSANPQPGDVPGILVQPYYWWEAGAMMGTLIDYWYYTGDSQYNDLVTEAMVFQLSPTYDYMPQNQSKDLGNDDQVFWGFSAMTAAEYKFPNPPDGTPAWISIAEAVFNSQAERWDTQYCGGGLRWQIFPFNLGYNYKNSPSNGGFLNLASRLYAYTGNQTYADWTVKTWDWMSSIGLISDTSMVYDGSDTTLNCSQLDHIQWTYSSGMMLNAAAVMWNVTNDNMWQSRAQELWNATAGVFFQNETMFEVACEPQNNCNNDQQSFKAYLSRYLAASTKWAPWLYDEVMPYLTTSAQAAAAQCSGNTDDTCGTKWTTAGNVWDGTTGVGQQMSALEVIQGLLVQQSYSPVTHNTGGISQGNATLGTGGDGGSGVTIVFAPITTADKAGAGILTAMLMAATVGGAYWVVT